MGAFIKNKSSYEILLSHYYIVRKFIVGRKNGNTTTFGITAHCLLLTESSTRIYISFSPYVTSTEILVKLSLYRDSAAYYFREYACY